VVAFCKLNETEAPAQTVAGEDNVFPGVGVPVHGFGGVQVKVNPEAGLTVVLCRIEVDVVFVAPAVEEAQLVVVVLFLKSEVEVPRNPTKV
jgi:hypothetical protein